MFNNIFNRLKRKKTKQTYVDREKKMIKFNHLNSEYMNILPCRSEKTKKEEDKIHSIFNHLYSECMNLLLNLYEIHMSPQI
jgi:hypothetical protein